MKVYSPRDKKVNFPQNTLKNNNYDINYKSGNNNFRSIFKLNKNRENISSKIENISKKLADFFF
ncbi:MAG: hypothetical protein GX259_10410 [Bacteroidales bacterium]|jgi:vacuolar-type H+-ATPase subunit I/STV1|nr:hypothetical protein [Bacteroidales bacterium]